MMETKSLQLNQMTKEQVDLIKRTVCKGATDDELLLFLYTSKRTGLDPLTRQLHAVKRWDSVQKREVMAIQTGIDGYRLIAQRTGQYVGSDDPTYDTETAENPTWAKVTVRKLLPNNEIFGITATARWNEYAQKKSDGMLFPSWRKMPYLMLGKCAEALALRKAFPAELSGIYTEEEVAIIGDKPPVQPPSRTSAPSDGKSYPSSKVHEELWGHCLEMAEGNEEKASDLLETLTTWIDTENKTHPGKRSIGQVSPKQAYTVLHQISKKVEREKEPGSDG